MAENTIKRCPQCGKWTADRLVTQCPDCKVPFISDRPAITPDLLKLLAGQVLSSWRFWAGLACFVALGAWGVITVAEKFIDVRANSYLNTLQQQATNHLEFVAGQISNQVVHEFQQPRIRATMEQVADDRANEFFTNAIWPSLEAFRINLNQANDVLARSTNDLAALQRDIKTARQKAAVAPSSTAGAAAANPPAATAKLTLVDQQVSKSGNGYVLSLFFKSSTGKPVGPIDLIAGTYRQTAKILNFAAVPPAQSAPPILNDLGDAARLTFVPPGKGDGSVQLALEFTGPTIVRISGDVLDGDLTVPVAAENLPSAALK